MYPVIRMFWQYAKARREKRLLFTGTHVSHHFCLPWDIDLWMELNNGRTLTLYDMGRIPFAYRVGLIDALRKNRWGLTMAGASVRYRRRIRMFEKIEMRSRVAFWDERFMYVEQSMWKKNGECANHILYRAAITSATGMIVPADAAKEAGQSAEPPQAPEWVLAWIKADSVRPWPPMQEDLATLARS